MPPQLAPRKLSGLSRWVTLDQKWDLEFCLNFLGHGDRRSPLRPKGVLLVCSVGSRPIIGVPHGAIPELSRMPSRTSSRHSCLSVVSVQHLHVVFVFFMVRWNFGLWYDGPFGMVR